MWDNCWQARQVCWLKHEGRRGKKEGGKGWEETRRKEKKRGEKVPECGIEPADAHSVNTLFFGVFFFTYRPTDIRLIELLR